jgi:hypothetical protein
MLDRSTLEETVAIPKVGYRLLSSEVVNLTEDEVEQFRKLPATATERELKEGRVEHLNEKAEHGLLVTFHWVTAQLNGEVRRMNGQHSSIMLEKRIVKGTFPANLKVHREHFEVDDGEALALLFRQFDDRASGRSPLDISGVYQGLHPELAEVKRKIGKLVLDGYAWYYRVVEKAPMPIGDDVYGLFNNSGLYPLIKWLDALFAVKSKEMQYNQVVAAIVGTYMVNESAARTFWQDVVRLSENEDESTPQSVLSDWLLKIQAGKIDRPAPANVYQGCIYAWNAYRDGKNITTIRDDIKKNFLGIHD